MKKGAIVCVDDEPIILLALVQELKRTFGPELEYRQAMNADVALETIEELEAEGTRVVLIISDWLMPGMKGDEFLRIVNQRYPDIQNIMITGNANAEDIQEFKKLKSLVAIFNKPWNRVHLADTIRGVLQNWNKESTGTGS